MLTFDRRTIDASGAFLIGELEKLDQTVNLPLQEVTWQRDIDLREDLVMSDEMSSFTVTDFAALGSEGAGSIAWAAMNSSALTGVDVNVTKHGANLHIWAKELGYSVIELEAAQRLGRPIDATKYDALKMKYQQDTDRMVYVGDTAKNATGLINNPNIAPINLTVDWEAGSPDDILKDFNAYLEHCYERTGYTLVPRNMRVPTSKLSGLLRPISTGSDTTILDYVAKKSLCMVQNGVPLEILGLKWLNTAGTAGKGRVMAYTRDKKYVRYPLVPMAKTPLETRGLQQTTVYYAKLGSVEFPYPETVNYGDVQ